MENKLSENDIKTLKYKNKCNTIDKIEAALLNEIKLLKLDIFNLNEKLKQKNLKLQNNEQG